MKKGHGSVRTVIVEYRSWRTAPVRNPWDPHRWLRKHPVSFGGCAEGDLLTEVRMPKGALTCRVSGVPARMNLWIKSPRL
jgi:hypothetical protein